MLKKILKVDLTSPQDELKYKLVCVHSDGCSEECTYYDYDEYISALSKLQVYLESGDIIAIRSLKTSEEQILYIQEVSDEV